MIKLFTLATLLLSVSSFAAEDEKELILCPLFYLKEVKKTVEENGDFDKYKHCAVSCMLTLRCSPVDVMEIGFYKEFADVFGPGNAEMADLKADYYGISLVTSKDANSDSTCIQQCKAKFKE
jgi:hypothetical protein